jgi:photosystem II stability/assembly factor-like uncharacterized protein
MRGLILAVVVAVASPAHAQPVSADAYQELHWRMIGPFRGGRTRACSGVANNPRIYYVAPVNGGVWKTEDTGRTWRPIFDDQPTQSIGSLAVAPSNPNIIYAGSGEGLLRPDLSVGNGVYRSNDAGKTWTHVGLNDAQQIPALAIDPRNPSRVFAAVLGHPYGPSEQRGVYRSLDGGVTWHSVLSRGPNVGASSVVIDPQNPEIVYSALWETRLGPWEDDNEYQGTGGGLFKSVDGGATWRKLEGNGLPADATQFNVAIAPSHTSTLYVAVATAEHGQYGSAKGNDLFRSDDGGATWRATTTDERPKLKIGGGDLMVPVVDPRNPDLLYVASIVAMRSRDGGKTWTWLRGAPGGDDYQNLWINPTDPDAFVLVSDQGATVTLDGGATWSSWYAQPTAQMFHVAATADVPYRVCGGQQESGSACVATRGNDGTIGYREWRPVGISEYGYAAPDPKNADIVFGAGRNSVSKFSWSTGQIQDVTPIPVLGSYRVDRTTPLVFSPVDPSLLYYGANVVFVTRDGGQTWKEISPDLTRPDPERPASVGPLAGVDKQPHRGAIYALAPSYRTTRTLWAGTDDGKMWITRDGGSHWTDITPSELTAWSKVTQLDSSRFDDNAVYASVSRLRIDDLAPYIYRTHDGGKTWTAITAGLPPGPVNVVRADPIRRGLLYAGTETGVYVSFDDGDHWQSLQQDLPHTSVRDLIVHGDDLVVATHGRGFWVMDDMALLRQLRASPATTLFKPASAIRFARSLYPDTPVPPDEPYAENPPDGAIFDYYLDRPASSVVLEITDVGGKLVRRYSSSDPPELTAAELAEQLIPVYWVRPARQLATTAGMHRWVWDLRRSRPLALHYEYPISAVPHDTPRSPEGARVPAGTYAVKLTVDGKTFASTVEVKVDPRIKVAPAALAKQNQLETHLAELLDQSSRDLVPAQSLLEQLGAIATKSDAIKPGLAALTMLVGGAKDDGPGAPPTLRGVNRRIVSLYKAVGVDAAPTTAQQVEASAAERDLAVVTKQWRGFEAKELSAIQAELHHAGLPALDRTRPPAPSNGDEE